MPARTQSATEIHVTGRVLYLTKDTSLIARQLAGEGIEPPVLDDLMDSISTDEITPGRVCYYYDEKLGSHAFVGLRGGIVGVDSIKNGGFEVIVSGLSKGCGSSRETAPYAELFAGIKLVFARSFEKIYLQNCQNIGLLASTNMSLLDAVLRGERVPLEALLTDCDDVSSEVVRQGGLAAYTKARQSGCVGVVPVTTGPRPMNLAEKILAAHAAQDDGVGVAAVAPGDSIWVDCDLRFSHDYAEPMTEFLFKRAFGEDSPVADRDSLILFRDHLNLLDRVLTPEELHGDTWAAAKELPIIQRRFAEAQGLTLHDGTAICHTGMIESHTLPGMVVIGTDSHSCTGGVLGCFSFGVGSTDMANAWFTRQARVCVPKTVRVVLKGTLASGVSAKDVALYLLATDLVKSGGAIGAVLEFAGSGLSSLGVEERATLTNMSVECGAFTAIIEPDEATIAYIAVQRDLTADQVRTSVMLADEGAAYADTLTIDLADVRPMVALPSDPHNGVPVSEIEGEHRIQFAFGGSCTGGKRTDMDMYASVLSQAEREGRSVSPDVEFYLQFGSEGVRAYAESKGYVDLFRRVGVRILDPGCGACINSGPGVTRQANQAVISASNRNFPGRMGPGRAYLASPLTVAASAIEGRVVANVPSRPLETTLTGRSM